MGENILPKSITVLLLVSTCIAQQALGQISDNFTDGNLTDAPAWSGSVANFAINGSQQLQLNAMVAGSSVLTTPFSVQVNHNTSWEFYISQTFAGSASNNGRIYLMSNSADLTGSLNGYYLQFGENLANDAVELFRQTGTTSTSVLRGPEAQIAASFGVRVRVTRSSIGEWQMFIDPAGGTNFVATQTGVENTFNASGFFGIRCLYTIGNIARFYFDDIIVESTLAPDVSAPALSSVSIINPTQIRLNFSEALDATEDLTAGDYVLNDTIPSVSASLVNGDSAIHLTFDQAMKNGYTQKIHYAAAADPSANVLPSGDQSFLFFEPVAPMPNDIVINEIYPDPSPSIGLPPYEFIEIYNQSENPFQLANWKITDGSTTGVLSNRILLPKEYLILAPNEALASYSLFGSTMGLQFFPTLNNSGDHLQLKSPDENEIDVLSYTLAAYQSEDKDAGGYTIERIDPTDFCTGMANWRASENANGGTPGTQNSVYQITLDLAGPKLLSIIPKTANMVTLKFDERLSSYIPPLENFLFPYSQQVGSATFSNTEQDEIDLTFSAELDSTLVHILTVSDIFDCPGNPILIEFSSASFKMDVVKPEVDSVTLTASRIEIFFSEKVAPPSINNASILVEDGGGFTVLLSENQKKLTVELERPLTNGKDYPLTIRNISDLSGNEIDSVTLTVRFFEPKPVSPGDIVINELFSDPSPAVGLPEAEFIEIYNRSANAIDLSGWKITDGSSTSTFPHKIILPESYIILCQSNFASAYSTFGPTLAFTAIPSLNNSGDDIKLVSDLGVTIDSIHYLSSWYEDEDKKDGGWTIERINPNDFCGEIENWRASMHEKGGSPGAINSVFALTEDFGSPDFTTLSVIDRDSIVLHFSERLMVNVDRPENFLITPPQSINKVRFTDNTRRSIALKLAEPLDSLVTYSVTMQNMYDCPGNAMQADSAVFDFKLDNTAAEVEMLTIIDDRKLRVSFNKKIDFASIAKENFLIEPIAVNAIDEVDPKTLLLTLEAPLTNGKNYLLSISGIVDLAGNVSKMSAHSVLYFQAHPVSRKDILITEIFADPTPTQGLPETEFVEIFNRSENPIQLKNWLINDETHETRLNAHILLPGEYLVLTSTSKAFQFGKALGVASFPTLSNGGEPLILKDSTGVSIDSIFYSDEWYRDSEKTDGGWSLELIDLNNVCAEGENWTASEDLSGGTPGKVNSVIAEKPDLTPPEINSVIAISADTIVVMFNEKLKDVPPVLDDFTFTPSLVVDRIVFGDQSKRSYLIRLATPLENRIRYSLVLRSISDCAGNTLETHEPIFFVLPEEPEPADIIINEILFNPRPTGVDFVEIFNRSEKYINLKKWQVANLVNDTVVNRKQIADADLVFEPGDYMVLTPDANLLKGEYLQGVEEKMRKTQRSLMRKAQYLFLMKMNGPLTLCFIRITSILLS